MKSNSGTFKILGIRLLEGCGKHIVKNLLKNKFYCFYQNYTFDEEKNFVIESTNPTIPQTFFLPNVNIHAIVGKNGSGKSTIVEVIIRIINNLSSKVIGTVNQYAAENLIPIKNLYAELYYLNDGEIFRVKCEGENQQPTLCDSDNSFYSVDIDILKKLFYTIVVNYSHYAYNSEDYKKEIIGRYKKNSWIVPLFHKNDGYRTPIVLNPYREKGNININTENELSAERLVSLFIFFALHGGSFHEDYEVQSFRLKYDKDNINTKYKKAEQEYFPNIVSENKDTSQKINISFKDFESQILKEWNEHINISLDDFEKKYLVYKTISILIKYDYFKNYFNNQIKLKGYNEGLKDCVRFIINDKTHITLRIRQLIKYLLTKRNYTEGTLTNAQILNKIQNSKGVENSKDLTVEDILELLPPKIFKTTFYLQYRDRSKSRANILLTSLSSGEKQMLFSLSSVLYHLGNLNSIRGEGRVTYRNYQIILEEIELYYHPEYQRKFIKLILEYIKMMRIAEDKQIDIMIITHSPFTLSDIPKENILFLDNGKQIESNLTKETFCANFYDLLRYSFFLDDNAIGAFAEDKLAYIRDNTSNTLNESDILKESISLIGDKFIKNYFLSKLNNE